MPNEPSAIPPMKSEVARERPAKLERTATYVPRILQQHVVDEPDTPCWFDEGSATFVDISGFTKLSERLARHGKEGAEHISEAIGKSFESILAVAYEEGGSLLKFGGDAMLLWFSGQGHAARACRATVRMRQALRTVDKIEVPGAKATLRMSQGVHSGRFHFFAVGTSHTELLTVGPAWSRLVALEHEAGSGTILVSSDTAALLPSHCLGEKRGPGIVLRRAPSGHKKLPLVPRPAIAPEALAHCLPPAIREHVLAGGGTSEHRAVTVAFIRFEGIDSQIERQRPETAARSLHDLLAAVSAAADAHKVTVLASDIDADGGKLILTAGAPRILGDDEERMLLSVRKILDSHVPVAIRIGVHRGAVFAGDIGPFYRRTYTVMGDAVNLAARLMAKAEPGEIYATQEVLDRSNALFDISELPPFLVKGKAHPIRAWSVGRAIGSRTRHTALQQLRLIGRDAEVAALRGAVAAARTGTGRLIAVSGEVGAGKTRLIEALQDEAAGFVQLRAVCESYTASTPYAVWTELLREHLSFGRDDPDAVIEERLASEIESRTPELVAWTPLIAIVFGLQMAPTPEVEMLAEKNRRAKLHEVVSSFLAAILIGPTLVVFENAHNLDLASAELLSHLAGGLAGRTWLFAVAYRPSTNGFGAPSVPSLLRLDLQPLSASDAMRLARADTEARSLSLHAIEVVVKRSGGNPQFLRDLVRAAIASGGVEGLPDSAEAAAMAQIDVLTPEDRDLVRRAAVFGLTFHPRMLSWFTNDEAAPAAATWGRLRELFDEEPDGYMRFRRSLLRDAAYEGLPYKLRRKLHNIVAARLESEMENPEDSAGLLSLHYFEAGEYARAWRNARIAAKRASDAYAHAEAAGMYARALETGRRLPEVASQDLAAVHEALGDSWYLAGDFRRAAEAYTAARRLVNGDAILEAGLLLKRSRMESKLGKHAFALRWAARASRALNGQSGPEASRLAAQTTAWYATVLQAEGRSTQAIRWAKRAVGEAQEADDADALGNAYFVMGWANSALGGRESMSHFEHSLEAYQRSGNLVRQAALLNNLGVLCFYEGRWDEAMAHWNRASEESTKIGNRVETEVTRINLVDILINRGELAAAEKLLLHEMLPVWRALEQRYYLAACILMLGRAELRSGRAEQALVRFEEARSMYVHMGAQNEAFETDAHIAECRLYLGDPDRALESARTLLSRATSSKALAKSISLLERVRAYAMLQKDDVANARQALAASLAAARARGDLFETMMTLSALIEVDRREGVETAPEFVSERQSLIAKLSIRVAPPVPPVGS